MTMRSLVRFAYLRRDALYLQAAAQNRRVSSGHTTITHTKVTLSLSRVLSGGCLLHRHRLSSCQLRCLGPWQAPGWPLVAPGWPLVAPGWPLVA